MVLLAVRMENSRTYNTRIMYLRCLLLLFASLYARGVRGTSSKDFPGLSSVNCVGGTDGIVGPVEEGYSGTVEVLSGIPADITVRLVDHLFPEHLDFLELDYTPGATNATVRTKIVLDADALKKTAGVLYYSVMCQDLGKLNNTRKLTVMDINDNSPIFEQKEYSTTVSETIPLNTEVLKVKAVDADVTSENNRVSYSILPSVSPDFDVRNDGGVVLIRRLNYNKAKNYNLTIKAEDKGGLSDMATVLIEVTDFDNMNPYFDHTLYEAVTLEEQTGAISSVLPAAIKAQDGDTGINMPVIYSIIAVSPSKYLSNFNIDGKSGVISVVTGLDREEIEKITITIKAAQEDDSFKTANAVVTVTIDDVNDNSPAFDKSSYHATLLENSPTDSFVFKVEVTDLDEGGFIGTLQILPESVPFSIGLDSTVTVKNSAELDRETVGNFIFQIEAREADAPNRVVLADVNVTLLDENDNSPVFGRSKYEGKVFRNQTEGMLVVMVEATDLDAGVNGLVKYSIDGGNQEGYFSINVDTGEVQLIKTIPLEENKLLEFSLYVTARDGGVVSRSSTVLVEVLAPGDSKPHFVQNSYHGSIEEETEPGVTILKVGFIAVAPVVPVTLQVITDTETFAIDSNGLFTTKVKLDYETKTTYSVGISISDGTNIDEAVVEVQVVDINDNSPVFNSSSVTWIVSEDTEVGTNLINMTATDSDDGFNGNVRYSIQGGEGKFSIDPDSGLVSLTGALDRETQAGYSLKVEAQDQGRPIQSATASLLIQVSDVNDNSPRFTMPEYQIGISESSPTGLSLLTLTAVDEDEGLYGRIYYSIVTQEPPSTPAVFELESSTGVLLLAQGLDYESVTGYVLTVKAEDGGVPPLEGLSTVSVRVVDVNDNPPQFSQESYAVMVSENLPGGSSIVTLEVTDVDEGGFSNGYFVFTSSIFDINKQGLVSLKKDATLDRETKDNFLLQVIAVDQPGFGLNATAQLNITVLDYNDNTPQFVDLPDSIMVPEGEYSASNPGEVHRFLVTDSDIGANAEVTVSLSSPSTLFRFTEDGTLLVEGPLDRETRDVYELVIVASDNGTPQRQKVTTIRLSVTDVNDNTPVFSASAYTNKILVKDAKVGDEVLTLLATDKDIGSNSLITYSFSAGNFTYLSLDHESGVVTIASDLADIMEDTALDFTVMAQDHGLPPLNSTARGLISLMTVSLNDSVAFESPSYTFSIAENQPEGSALGVVRASPGNTLYAISYVLMTHTDLFTIDPRLGIILTKETLDKESQDWYILEVKAVDTRIPPTFAVALVRVEVEDVNEAPKFIDEIYQGRIFSIAPYKYPVVQVKATDPDSGDSDRLQYSFSEPSSYFDLDTSTGQVYVVSVVGLAGQTTTLTMKATDPSGLQATATLQVDVQGSVSSDVVIISLNQAVNIVEKKIPEMEESLGRALGWIVKVIRVTSSNGGQADSRTSSNNVKTFVSIIATDADKVIPAEEIREKLRSESDAVKKELEKVFGAGLEHDLVEEPEETSDNHSTVIALGVLLGLSMLGLVLIGTYTIFKFVRRRKNAEDSDKESFAIDNQSYVHQDREKSGDLNQSWRSHVIEEEEKEEEEEKGEEEEEAEPKPESQNKDSNSDDSQTSTL